MQHLDEAAEPPPHTRGRLRRQRDLGHEDDHAAPLLQRVGSRAQEHLGLARAGHAVEQELATAPTVIDRLLQPVDGGKLRLGRIERGLEIRGRCSNLDELALCDQLAHSRRRCTRAGTDVTEGTRGVLGCAQDRGLPRAAYLGPLDGGQPWIRRRHIAGGRQHQLECPCRRRGVALADLEREVDEVGGHTATRVRRRLERDTRGDVVVGRRAQNDALFLAASKRYLHDSSRRQIPRVRQRPLQPARRNERYDDNGVRAQRGARRPCRCAPS